VSAPRRVALGAWSLLLALQLGWHGMGWGGGGGSAVSALVHALPLLAVGVLFALRRPGAWTWAGIVALLYFCHGVAEAWATPAERVPALVEVALSVLLVFSVSWEGMRARFGAKARDRAV
jgi:uncharacterized membrane protein